LLYQTIIGAEDHLLVVINTDIVEEPKQVSIHNQLNDMDLPLYNGKPKVQNKHFFFKFFTNIYSLWKFTNICYYICQIAVIQSFEKEADLNLIPPGPDYLMLSVQYNTAESKRRYHLIFSCRKTSNSSVIGILYKLLATLFVYSNTNNIICLQKMVDHECL